MDQIGAGIIRVYYVTSTAEAATSMATRSNLSEGQSVEGQISQYNCWIPYYKYTEWWKEVKDLIPAQPQRISKGSSLNCS